MKQSLIALIGCMTLLSGGLVLLDETKAAQQVVSQEENGTTEEGHVQGSEIVEQWVSPNLLRIRIDGRWEELPLIPLADHLCRSKHRLFKKYCGDEVLAPQNDP